MALLWVQNRDLRAQLNSASASASPGPLWSAVLDPQHVTYLVLADGGFVLAQEFSKRKLTLSDYLKPGFGQATGPGGSETDMERLVERIGWPRHTSPTEAQLAAKIGLFAALSKGKLQVRFARDMGVRDFRGNHAILIGSVRSNPWVELFEPRLNFHFDYDFSLLQALIRNRSPRPGERALYRAGGRDGTTDEIYALAALLPNLTNDGRVLILSGTRTEGTESAGELLADPERSSGLLHTLGLLEKGRVNHFEILFKSSRLQGTSRAAEVVTWRRIPD